MTEAEIAKKRVDDLSNLIKKELDAKMYFIRNGKFPPGHFGVKAIIVK